MSAWGRWKARIEARFEVAGALPRTPEYLGPDENEYAG